MEQIDFSEITACGENCTKCDKMKSGACAGCIAADGCVPEWAESGRCPIHACCQSHQARFCGVCPEFPCSAIRQLIHWNPDVVEHLRELAELCPREPEIRRAKPEDARSLAELAAALWPDHTAEEFESEMAALLADRECAFFLAEAADGPVALAQCQLRRDYVEGTESSPVGYLEGIYVTEEYRRRGLAGKLLRSCEHWAKEMGCREFASDCELANEASREFHLRMGFAEAGRIICFTKKL